MPGNPAVRGMIRNEMQVILPQTVLATANADQILAWLREQYPNTLQGRSVVTPRETLRTTPLRNEAPETPTGIQMRRLENGDLGIRGLSLNGNETGHADFRCRISYRAPSPEAEIRVPAAHARSQATIHAWLTEHAVDAGLEEFTQDYEHTNFERRTLVLEALPIHDTQIPPAAQ